MKLQLKLIAAAVAIAAAGQAGAVTGTGDFTSGNGDLIFTAWDNVANVSYTRDLGVTMSNFLTGTTGATPAAFAHSNSGVDAAGYSALFAADANMASFLGQVTAANVQWSVIAGDSAIVRGGSAYGGYRYLTTTTADKSGIASQANSKLTSFTAANVYVTAAVPAGGSTIANSASGAAYADNVALNGMGNNWGNNFVAANTAGVGQSQNFFFLTPSDSVNTDKAFIDQYSNQYGNSTWTLSSTGNLTYAAATAPVPEADTWAMFGVGLLAIGAAVRRSGRQPKIFKELA